jgi:hypothetical protein
MGIRKSRRDRKYSSPCSDVLCNTHAVQYADCYQLANVEKGDTEAQPTGNTPVADQASAEPVSTHLIPYSRYYALT